jgi:tetratricopeptide (TPR) repeat protein
MLSNQDFELQFRLARELQALGKFAEAKSEYEKINTSFPNRIGPLQLLGWVNAQLGLWSEAIDSLSKAIQLNPTDPHSYYVMGVVMCRFESWAAGIECFDKTLLLVPTHIEALCDRASALIELKLYDDALSSYRNAIEINAAHSAAHFGCGNALYSLQRIDEALAYFLEAIRIKPDYAEAFVNLGKIYHNKGLYLLAMNCFDKAIDIDDSNAIAHSNRSIELKYLHRLDESLISSNRAISLKPDYYDAYWNRSLTHLLKGNLNEGFIDYQYRWETTQFQAIKRNYQQPLWLGKESLFGKTLLVYNEQGFGDSIQFCRYLALARDAGAKVIYEVAEPLYALFNTLGGVAQLVKQTEVLPDFDYYCPLLSLPIGFNTQLNSIPCAVPYLSASSEKMHIWQAKLGQKSRPRVGLCWSGSPTHQGDKYRSIPFAKLAAYLPGDCEYISLQKKITPSDYYDVSNFNNIKNFADDLHDFSDTAALASILDLVITVDTSVAHLAGALGIATWVLLPRTPDWRWMLERDDSPWYPTIKLYRQEVDGTGDWGSTLLELGQDLSNLINI